MLQLTFPLSDQIYIFPSFRDCPDNLLKSAELMKRGYFVVVLLTFFFGGILIEPVFSVTQSSTQLLNTFSFLFFTPLTVGRIRAPDRDLVLLGIELPLRPEA